MKEKKTIKKKVRLAISVTPQLADKIRIASIQRKTNPTGLLLEALEAFLRRPVKKANSLSSEDIQALDGSVADYVSL